MFRRLHSGPTSVGQHVQRRLDLAREGDGIERRELAVESLALGGR
jgi:hypothetical protein